MNVIILAYVPALIGLAVVALLVYMRKSRATATYLSFVAALIFIILWQSVQLVSLFTEGELALCLMRVSIVVSNFMTPLFLLFAVLFPYSKQFPRPSLLLLLFIPAILLTPLSFHPDMITHVAHIGISQTLTTGILYEIQAVYTIIITLAAAGVLMYKAAQRRGNERKAILFILVAFLIPLTIGVLSAYVFNQPNNTVILLTPASFFVTSAVVAYAMVRHQLFDIRLTIVRTIVYGGVLITLSSTYYLIAYILSISLFGASATTSFSVSPVNIVLALVLAFLFQPVKKFFDRMTNKIFYRDTYTSDDFFATFSRLLASTSDLRGLLERAATDLATTMKSRQGFFYVHYSGGHHISAGTKHHSRMVASDVALFDEYVRSNGNDMIVAELLVDKPHIYRIMVSYKIAIVLPLRHIDNVIGYLCLGEHQGSGYTSRDIKVLETVSDELVVAIQNALSIQEIKELNATLQQRVDNATQELRASNEQLRHLDEVKDEFISMASHQLRTPLTSIKGYISMVIEGDMGKISPQQTTVLEEAFNSSERMVRLISDFLNVSRLQTGKFIIDKHSIDLATVVRQEVDSLKLIAKAHDQTLKYEQPSGIPKLNLDEGKIRQVIMNFIDNAVYYSRSNSTITVTLEQTKKEIIFVVQDTGIGVPKVEQSKLFAKFFRATNARKQRPDGTGVGLFLAKKVITAHDGAMVFSSIEGEGSRFGFRIPLATNIADTTA